MKFKSLLLGTASILLIGQSARAADAVAPPQDVMITPEPAEYVRVCDTYGTGFFYAPGTETCIRFSGLVRSSYETVALEGDLGTESHRHFWGQRARLNVDTRNETEWGTLRGLFRLEAGDSNTDADIDMDVALLSFRGFRAGFIGSNFWSSNHSFAGANLTGMGAVLGASQDDGYYGFNDGTMIDYTYATDGFSVTVGAEDPRIDYANLGAVANTFSGGADGRANFYAGINVSGEFGSIGLTAVHDSTAIDSTAFFNGLIDDGGWAYKASVTLDLSKFIPGGMLHGMYMWDGDYITNYVHTNGSGIDDAESIYQIAFHADVTDELQFVAQHSHAEGSDWSVLQNGGARSSMNNTSVGFNWAPAAAPGFSIRASYTFGDVNNPAGILNGELGNQSYDFDGYFLSARRDF